MNQTSRLALHPWHGTQTFPKRKIRRFSCLDGLGVGKEVVVERVPEVRYHNESNDCPAGRAGARVLLQELGAYNQIAVSPVTFHTHYGTGSS